MTHTERSTSGRRRRDAPIHDGVGARVRWGGTAGAAAVAFLFTLVLWIQLTSPGGMLLACLGEEVVAFHSRPHPELPVQAGNLSSASQCHLALAAELHPSGRYTQEFARSEAGAWLLERLASVEQTSAPELVDPTLEAEQYRAIDARNLVSRVAFACLFDTHAMRMVEAAPAALERFEAIESVVEAHRTATGVTLYGDFLHAARWKAIDSSFRRPDVATCAALTKFNFGSNDYFETDARFVALPAIQRRLCKLRDALAAQGHGEAVARINRWLAELWVGLIEGERDPATRLLCAELLAKSFSDRPAVREPMGRLRADYHRAVMDAPIDLAQRNTRGGSLPTLAPVEYPAAIASLAATVALFVMGLGAAAMLIVSLVIAVAGRGAALRAETEDDGVASKATRALIVAIGVVPGIVAMVWHFSGRGLYSESWLVVIAMVMLGMGALLPIAATAVAVRVGARVATGPRILVAASLLLLVMMLAFPPAGMTNLFGSTGLTTIIVVTAIVVVGLVVVALIQSPGRAKTVASLAALAWCVCAAGGEAALQVHRHYDRAYQEAVVAAAADEVGARLGKDWMATYVDPVREPLGLPTK